MYGLSQLLFIGYLWVLTVEMVFLNTLVALLNEPNTTVVERSSVTELANLCLIFIWIGASTVAKKRVAIVTPQAPMDKAAASWLPLAVAPLQMTGTDRVAMALASITQLPTSSK